MFASDLDAASRRQLERGSRLTELLRQGQYAPYAIEDQIVSVWSGIEGHFVDVPVDDVLRFEQEFLDYLRHNSDVLQGIAGDFLFGDDRKSATVSAMGEFKKIFRTSEGKLLVGREEHKPLGDEEIGQETIVRQKRG